MAEDTTCKSKEKIDSEAKQAMHLIEKLLKAQTSPKDLHLDLQEVKQHLENISMDLHTGGPMLAHEGGEFSHTGN